MTGHAVDEEPPCMNPYSAPSSKGDTIGDIGPMAEPAPMGPLCASWDGARKGFRRVSYASLVVGLTAGSYAGKLVDRRLAETIAAADRDDPNRQLDDPMKSREPVPEFDACRAGRGGRSGSTTSSRSVRPG
jgi:hypothetical protein